jgi:hypothetical protein
MNLSELTFVDAIREEELSWLGRIGAKFIAENAYFLDVCERLHLALVRKCANSPPSDATALANPFPARRSGE